MSRFLLSLTCVILLLTSGLVPTMADDTASHAVAKQKVLFQVSDNDSAKWNLALGNVRNMQIGLGKDNVEIEIVVYGPGLPMLKLDSSVAARIGDTLAQGVKIVACENTMASNKLTPDDILPNVGYVKSGVVELALKQQQGWAYIRP